MSFSSCSTSQFSVNCTVPFNCLILQNNQTLSILYRFYCRLSRKKKKNCLENIPFHRKQAAMYYSSNAPAEKSVLSGFFLCTVFFKISYEKYLQPSLHIVRSVFFLHFLQCTVSPSMLAWVQSEQILSISFEYIICIHSDQNVL